MITLPNNTTAAVERESINMPFAQWTDQTTAVLSDGNYILTLQMKRRNQLQESASLVGARLEIESPMLLMMLAHCAYFSAFPSRDDIAQYNGIARRVFIPAVGKEISKEHFSDAQIRQFVDRELQNVPGHHYINEAIGLPGNPWSICRSLFIYGAALWRVRGEIARWIGSFPTDAPMENLAFHIALITMANTMLPLTDVDMFPVPSISAIDFLSLIGGPQPVPQVIRQGFHSGGMSLQYFGTDDERLARRLAIRTEHAHALQQLASILLDDLDRPPRYIDTPLDVSLPSDLLPRLGAFGVAGILVVPKATGMYVALLDGPGDYLAVAWWQADPISGERCPLTVPASCWTLLHPLLSAFWHDLCADAVLLDEPPRAPDRPPNDDPQSFRAKPPRRHRRAILPPVQRIRAAWGSPEDREAIRAATYVGHGYRRLPGDWQGRMNKRDFLSRQQAARERAKRHGYPEPPPGFTFVKAFVRGLIENPQEQMPERPEIKVRSRGLFTLMLGVQEGAARAATLLPDETW